MDEWAFHWVETSGYPIVLSYDYAKLGDLPPELVIGLVDDVSSLGDRYVQEFEVLDLSEHPDELRVKVDF